jgi:hypothetical protein
MDICEMSIFMHQASLQNAVSTSVLKIALNRESETNTEMLDMASNMAVDTSKGINLDVTV